MKRIDGEDWQAAWGLEDYVIDLFKRKATDTPEFKTLLKVFGRDKILKIWEKFKLKNSSN